MRLGLLEQNVAGVDNPESSIGVASSFSFCKQLDNSCIEVYVLHRTQCLHGAGQGQSPSIFPFPEGATSSAGCFGSPVSSLEPVQCAQGFRSLVIEEDMTQPLAQLLRLNDKIQPAYPQSNEREQP